MNRKLLTFSFVFAEIAKQIDNKCLPQNFSICLNLYFYESEIYDIFLSEIFLDHTKKYFLPHPSQAQGPGTNRGGKRGGRREGASQKVFEIGRKFSSKSYRLCRIL